MAIEVKNLRVVQASVSGLTKHLNQETARRLKEAGLLIKKDAEKALKSGGFRRGPRGGKIPSPRPAFPHIFSRTGRLKESLEVEATLRKNKIQVRVSSNVAYAAHLEYGTRFIKTRAWVANTLKKDMPIVMKMVDKGITDAIKKSGLK